MQVIAFDRSIDQLEQDLVTLSHRVNAAEYEFLELVREFDMRQGWRLYHLNNCAEWLNMKCGVSLGTAREKVRVALALYDLPRMTEAFREGVISYSMARAMTRVANRDNEQQLVDFALKTTTSNVEDYCRQLRNAHRETSTEDANRAHRARRLSCSRDADGMVTISVELPRESGELVVKAIEMAAATLTREKTADDEGDGFFARQADALVEMARQYLSPATGDGDTAVSSSDNYQVLVHVDEPALRDESGKSDLPVETVRRLTCDGNVVEITKDAEGNPLDLGRKRRTVSPQLKRALLSRDKHCRYPGCSHGKWLDAHHVMHWADGGETNLDNTLLLCSKHHRLLHEGGYTIEKNYQGEWYFKTSTGRAIADLALYPSCETNASRDARNSRIREPAPLYCVAAGAP